MIKSVLSVSFHQTAWTWRGDHFEHFAMKLRVVVTPLYILQSAPNFTFDKSPSLKTSTHQHSVIVIVPPTPNRKLHVLLFDALLLEG